jgi:hypothetical protein
VTGAVAPRPIDLRDLGRGAWGTFVHGSPRAIVLRTAFALAKANDPLPTWVDIRDREGESDVTGPTEMGWIGEERLFFVTPADARPQDAVANMALWSVVRSDEPTAVIASFTDFLRLPPTVQDAVSRRGIEASRPVFVVANTDRVRAHYPKDVGGVRPIVEAMLHAGVLPIFSALGPPTPGRLAFDFVLEAKAPSLAQWNRGALACEKAPPGTSFAPGTTVPLAELPGAAEFFEPADAAPG